MPFILQGEVSSEKEARERFVCFRSLKDHFLRFVDVLIADNVGLEACGAFSDARIKTANLTD